MFFKKKRKPLEDLTNQELEEFSVQFTEDGGKALNILNDRQNELIDLYSKAYKGVKAGLYNDAVKYIDEYIKKCDRYGEIVKQYVYDLLVMAVIDGKALSGDVCWVYDEIIKYYQEKGNEEYAADYLLRKEDYIKEVEKMIALRDRYNFDITEDIARALFRLEGLKVNEYRLDDYATQDSFGAVWKSVLHEVDLYEEGEESPLNKITTKGAKRWLKEFSHLCTEVRIPDEYKGGGDYERNGDKG